MKRLLIWLIALSILVGCAASPDTSSEQINPTAETAEVVSTADRDTAGSEAPPEDEQKDDNSSTDKDLPAAEEKTAPAEKETASTDQTAAVMQEPAGPTVTLWVTGGFASQKITAKEAVLNPGDTVIDILKANTEVETQYGGGFVSSINGLATGYTGPNKEKRDWFYYMNGIMTAVGAQNYLPVSGDVIWWDYHDWGGTYFTPAVIGAFPQPFVNGYQGKNPGTLILAAKGCEQKGEQVASYLRRIGVKSVEVKPYDESLLAADDKITVVIGLWSDFSEDAYWQGLQSQRQKTGLFAKFTPQYFAALNVQGEEVQRYQQHVGAVAATGSGMGDVTPVWLITGLDQAGLADAVNVLTDHPEKIKQQFGVLIADGDVVPLPIKQN